MDLPSANDAPDTGRRKIMKNSAFAGAVAAAYGWLSPRTGSAQNTTASLEPTPYLEPFLDPLTIPPIKTTTLLQPRPGRLAVAGEAGRDPHQRYQEFLPQREYEVRVRAFQYRYHLHLPLETVWGYDGMIPGPTFVGRVGQPALVRFRNELPQNHVGYGSPEICTHLHGGHVGSASDGFADNYFSPTKAGASLRNPGAFYDHHYPHYPSKGDARNITNTLWYHDHREDFTAPNVYRGLAGAYILFDSLDSGSESSGLRLPSGVGRYDIPLILQDKKFDSGGNLSYNQFDAEGFVGNLFLVNGKVQPYFNVEGRKYRFRLINGSLARYFEMYLGDESNRFHNFTFIASDGNLLERPLTLQKILMGMGERADIIVDFSKYPPGTKLYLVNRLEQVDPRKPTGKLLTPGIRMLRFEVGPRTTDNSVIPAYLRALAPFNRSAAKIIRSFRFERNNGQWSINGKFWDPERVDAAPKLNVPEIWKLQSDSGGWAHPIHVHLDDYRILSINGNPPPPEWRGRKDVLSLLPGDYAEILVEFRDFTGKYMMHCHQQSHEDHAMMIRFDVVP